MWNIRLTTSPTANVQKFTFLAPVNLKAIDVFPSSGRWIEDHVLPPVSMHLSRWRHILLKQQKLKARSGVNLQEKKGFQRVPLGSTWPRARNSGSPKNIKQRTHVWWESVYYRIPIFYFLYKYDCTITKNNGPHCWTQLRCWGYTRQKSPKGKFTGQKSTSKVLTLYKTCSQDAK